MRLVIEIETPVAPKNAQAEAGGKFGYAILIAARRACRQARRLKDGRGVCQCGLRASGKHWVETFVK